MGKFTCDLCQCTLDDYKSHRQHRIEHIKQRDWINSANATNKRYALHLIDFYVYSSNQRNLSRWEPCDNDFERSQLTRQ